MKTAVLFLVFNRPDTTVRVFETIRQARPPRLYVAADGPRKNRTDENEKCEKKKFSTDEFLHGVKSHSDNIHSISKDSEIEI